MAQQRVALTVKAVLGVLMLVALSLAVVGLAGEHYAPLRDSPTSTELSEDAPLAEAFREAFVGDTGVYDPAAGIVTPDETHFDVEIKAAFNDDTIFFQYTFPTPLPSLFHGASVFREGEWVRLGQPPVRGPEPDGLYEDKLAMFIDDGSVRGFSNQGGWITCHEDVRGMYGASQRDEITAHPVFGEQHNLTSMPKYLPQSRDTGPQWWRFPGWDAVPIDALERFEQRQASGVFLDLWLWGSHRTNPTGHGDNELVFDYRRSGPGTGPFRPNWDGEAAAPAFMFDAELTGFFALDWETLQAGGYGLQDHTALVQGVSAVPFDPEREWREGDVIPSVILNPQPTESRGSVNAEGQLLRQDDGSWEWQVTLWRALDTGVAGVDKVLKPGRTYDVAVAVHRLATGSRWHFVSLPFTVGLDTPATVTARRFQGEQPEWNEIDAVSRTLVYPGQTTWQWLVSGEHPGAEQVRNDAMSVVGCHDEVGLGASNREIEAYLAGLSPSPTAELAVARAGFDPSNVVFWFTVLAILIVLVAILLGRVRRS